MPRISEYRKYCVGLLDDNIEAEVLEGGWYTRYMVQNFYPEGVVKRGHNLYPRKKSWPGDPYTVIPTRDKCYGCLAAWLAEESDYRTKDAPGPIKRACFARSENRPGLRSHEPRERIAQ